MQRASVIPFGRRKRLDITAFRGEVYVHINDLMKSKCVSLQILELEELLSCKPKIDKKVNQLKRKLRQNEILTSDSEDTEKATETDILLNRNSKREKKNPKGTKKHQRNQFMENITPSNDESDSSS